MKKIIKKIYKNTKKVLIRFKEITKIKDIVNMETYYPEKERKSKKARYWDNFIWVIKYGTINQFYNLYGMDLKDKNKEQDYCDYTTFMEQRNEYNMNLNTPKERYNYIALLRDKNIFEKLMKSIDVKTANTVAIIKDGIIYDKYLDKIVNEKQLFKNSEQYFIKAINGECADGVFFIRNYKNFLERKKIFDKGIYIIQEKLIQNEEINKLNPNAVNTLRVVTVNNGKDIKILSTICRIGTQKNGNVDNWSVGGIAVEVNQNGYLNEYGYYKPSFGTKTKKHPDTNVEFKNFKIPYYNEIENMVIKAHKTLYGIHSIGWDVAITKNGPVLIEGNDNWAISIMQISRGLKREWNKTLYRGNK